MKRKVEHECEELLRYYALGVIVPTLRISGLGYAARTLEGRLAAGELVCINGSPRRVTPNMRHDPQMALIKRTISSNADVYPRLVYWLYGYPLIAPCSKKTTHLIERYAHKERCSKRTAWERRRRLLEEIARRALLERRNSVQATA